MSLLLDAFVILVLENKRKLTIDESFGAMKHGRKVTCLKSLQTCVTVICMELHMGYCSGCSWSIGVKTYFTSSQCWSFLGTLYQSLLSSSFLNSPSSAHSHSLTHSYKSPPTRKKCTSKLNNIQRIDMSETKHQKEVPKSKFLYCTGTNIGTIPI